MSIDCNDSIIFQIKKEKYVYYYCHNKTCSGKKPHAQSNIVETNSRITGEKLFQDIGKILEKTFKLDKRLLTLYLLKIEKENQAKYYTRKTDLQRIEASKAYLEKQIEEKTKELTKALSKLSTPKTVDAVMKQHEKEIALLKGRLNEQRQKEEEIKRVNHTWTQYLRKWLELTRNVYLYWKNATLAQKTNLAQKLYLELEIKDGKVASNKYKEPFNCLKNTYLPTMVGERGLEPP